MRNDTAVSERPVNYAEVHALFCALVIEAARHPNRVHLRDLTDALSPVRDDEKLANLRRIEAQMEAEK